MWFASFRDLQFRSRRLLIGTLAASVLFGVTLLFQGLSASLDTEAGKTFDAVGADLWFTDAGVTGPLSGASVIPAGRTEEVRALDGITRADPIIVVRDSITGGRVESVTVFGHVLGGLGSPTITDGHAASRPGEAVVNDNAGLDIGDTFKLGRATFVVVGETHGRSITGGVPSIYISLADAQAVEARGLDIATAVVATGHAARAPDGLHAWTSAEVRDDLLRLADRILVALGRAKDFLWVAAGLVIGSIVYLSTRERFHEFAVMKAIGVPTRAIVGGNVMQAFVVTAAAVTGGSVGARIMLPLFPIPLVIPAQAVVTSALAAVAIAVIASLAATRAIVTVDPGLAFGKR